MLAPKGRPRTVSSQRNETQQSVEIEAAQSSDVVADPKLSFDQQRLGRQGDSNRERSGKKGQGCAAWREPAYRDDRQHQLEEVSNDQGAQRWQRSQVVHAMIPFRHVRGETAMKVAVHQSRDLRLKSGTKSHLESSAEAELAQGDRNLQQDQKRSEDDDRRHGSESLTRHAELGG